MVGDADAWRTTRRRYLASGVRRAVAVATAGGLLAACARPGAVPGPRPAVQDPVVTLRFMPWWTQWSGGGLSLLKQACALFEAAHAGVRLQPLPGPNGTHVTSDSVLAAMLSGTGPDVVCDYGGSFAAYVAAGAFADLRPLLAADGISPSTWSAAHMAALRTPAGQFGLPTYDGPCVYAYRRDILDALHLAPPDANWTYVDAENLWRRCALPAQVAGTGRARYGATVWWWNGWKASNWLFSAFGGAEMDAAATRATLTDTRSLAGGQWLLPLLWYGVVGTFDAATLQQGNTVFALRGGWSIQDDVVAFGNKFPWDYAPVPVYPFGRATFGNNDFWGLNALGRQAEPAWELMKWLTYEDGWQRFCIKTALLQPCKNALWEEWEATIRAAAPILRNKALNWYRDAAQGGYGYAEQFFRYQPARADAVLAQGMRALSAGPVDVAAAFGAMNAKIDVLQRAGSALQGRLAAAVRQFATPAGEASGGVLIEPPSVSGLGTPPTAVPVLITSRRAGVYRVVGGGAAVGALGDGCTFACVAENISTADYVCRVTALVDGDCPSLAPLAMAGLMVRGDLSDDAPMALISATAAQGVQTLCRMMAGYAAAVQAAPAAGAGGLLPPSRLNAQNPGTRGNALRAPVWLRLRRRGGIWTAWTSGDGRRWSRAGLPMPVLMTGAWVGVFVSAANGYFPQGAGRTVHGAFDRLSFVPRGLYRIGRA